MEDSNTVQLSWLDGTPEGPASSTFGVPWSRGSLARDTPLSLHSAEGTAIPLQSRPLAFWPDGSVKWTGHAVSVAPPIPDNLVLRPGRPGVELEESVRVFEHEHHVRVETPSFHCRVNRRGRTIFDGLENSRAVLCGEARLVAILERRGNVTGRPTATLERFESEITSVSVEQRGPVRAVIRIDGRHQSTSGDRACLPFRLRISFHALGREIRMVHTFTYDANPHKDFIRGLGLSFDVPMSSPLYNRQVRFAGDTGYFAESCKSLLTRPVQLYLARRRAVTEIEGVETYAELYRRQLAGKPVHLDPDKDAAYLRILDDAATWSDFRLVQGSSDSYAIHKRTRSDCSWVKAAQGGRSRGFLYAGCESGGLAVGLRSFWEKHPSALEALNLSKETATITCWLWPPDAPAMDLRHYDTETHVESAYEGGTELRSTPYGIAATSEISLWGLPGPPTTRDAERMTRENRRPPQLICEPERYHDTKALGVYSLPDRSTPARARLEDELDALFAFYRDEVDLRRWYGFWDWGDVMHNYDAVRHTWCYDLGGFAWQNTELVPNMWLWYVFLRSARPDVFRLAEAMTRHTSEVDLYHLGEYRGLGSRHNVVHWGCTAKEARIGMAGLHRFYHYLTADERTGDILSLVKDADYTTLNIDPMRAYFQKDQYPTHTRSGPDWAAFCSNWFTQWERFEEDSYREKIEHGIDSLASMPFRLLSGPTFGYDPKTGDLHHMGEENYSYHMVSPFGAPQVWLELVESLDEPYRETFSSMIAEFGRYYALSPSERARRSGGALGGREHQENWRSPLYAATLTAFAAIYEGTEDSRDLAAGVWDTILPSDRTTDGAPIPPLLPTRQSVPSEEYIRPISEVAGISTNSASQWALNVIVCLELIGEYLEENRLE
jgi:hypothetical protein